MISTNQMKVFKIRPNSNVDVHSADTEINKNNQHPKSKQLVEYPYKDMQEWFSVKGS